MSAPNKTTAEPRVRLLIVVNAAGAVAAAAFAARGLTRPGYVRPGSVSTSTTRFWAASSAVRTWAVTGPLLANVIAGRRPPRDLLTVAGLIQLGDSVLGLWQRKTAMAVAPAVMGTIHLASAHWLTGAQRRAMR